LSCADCNAADNCATCSATTASACSTCIADTYWKSSVCTSCGDGKYSAAGTASATAATACKSCDDSNCLECEGAGAFQCTKCAANYYLDVSSCVTCPAGKWSAAGVTTCAGTCNDANCKSCTDAGAAACTACNSGYVLDATTNTCTICADTQCDTCTSGIEGQCTLCKNTETHTLTNGVCKANTFLVSLKENGGIATTVIFSGTLTLFESMGGKGYFAAKMADILGVDVAQIEILSVTQGSIIVLFKVYSLSSDTTVNAGSLQALLDAAESAGSLNIYGTSVVGHASEVITVGACADGYYKDGFSVCRACPDDCDTCTSGDEKCGTNVGAIVGGVIGGVALVVIIVIIYLKRNAIKKMISPGNYNKVASTPTNAQKA